MIFLGCALFTYDGSTYMTNVFLVVNLTDLGSTQQDVAGVLVHKILAHNQCLMWHNFKGFV